MTTSALDEITSYVPALILQRIAADSGATLAPAAEEFPAAVLMADLSGFTALTEYLTRHNPAGAEELTNILNLYFGHLVRVVTAHGGDVVKFAGDGLLALWYGDEPTAVLAQRAVQCGLAVQMMMAPDVWGVSDDDQPPTPLKVRVGVGAGSVTIMYLGGVFARWELLVTGPAVLEAGQAEANARPGDVLIGPQAWDLVAGACMGTLAAGGAVRLDALLDDVPMQALAPPLLEPSMADMLRAYLPKAILSRLDAGQTAWLAEQRRVSVLFVNLPDLRADTPLADAQAQMRAIQSMLYRYEGSISRLGTDGKGPTLVAALGLPPLSHEDDPERGVRAALEIYRALREMEFSCAIGVTTGIALCGAVGGTMRREYTMMGTIVNRSARLMQAAAAESRRSGRPALLCDGPTYRATRRNLPFEPLPPIRLKGVTEAVEVFLPLDEQRAVVVPPPQPPSGIPLVGRGRERQILTAAVAALPAGQGAIVLIEGEAGIGKSRLLDVLRDDVQPAGVRVLNGAANPVEKTPYFAWRSIALSLFDQADPGAALGELAALAPLLNSILSVDLPETALTSQITGHMRAENIRDLLVYLVAAAAALSPLLIILDDAHWMDTSSWALLHQVADQVPHLMIVLALRPNSELPDEYHRLLYRSGVQRLVLRGLEPAEVGELLGLRLGAVDVPEPLWRVLADRALGNPFFSEELALALRDNGLISVIDGRCRLAPDAGDLAQALTAIRLPDTVHGLITSRIDRLSAAQQLTLKVASVIGPSFTLSDLVAIHPVERNSERLVDQLFALQQAGIVAIEGLEPELSYTFRPVAACEVVYSLMSFAQRRQLHRVLAERIAAGANDPVAYAQLAYHWRAAAEPARALEYLGRAGEHALLAGAYRESVGFLSDALTIAADLNNPADLRPNPAQVAQWERQLGEALHGIGKLIESRELLARAVARLGHALPRRFGALVGGLLHELAIQAARRLGLTRPQSHQGQAGALIEAARAYGTLAQLAYYDSQILASLYAALRGLNLAEQAGISPELAGTYASAQVALSMFPPLARRYHHLAQRSALQLNHLPTIVWTSEANGLFALAHGDWRRAQAALRYALMIAERLGDQRRRAECLALLCLVSAHQGRVRDALSLCRDVETIGMRSGDSQVRTWGLVGAAENLLTLGDLDAADTLFDEADVLLAENINAARAEEIWTYALMARAALRRGDDKLARSLSAAAARLVERMPQAAIYALAGYSALAEVSFTLLARTGQRSLLAQGGKAVRALQRFAWFFPIARPAALRWRAAWLFHEQRMGPARRNWRRSAALARRYGMPYDEGSALLALAPHSKAAERETMLRRAAACFAQVGAAYELAQVAALR